MSLKINNAKITKASLTMEDHGLTFFLTLDGGGWGVNYGGYMLGKGFWVVKNLLVVQQDQIV